MPSVPSSFPDAETLPSCMVVSSWIFYQSWKCLHEIQSAHISTYSISRIVPGVFHVCRFIASSCISSTSLLVCDLHRLCANCSSVQCLSCRNGTIISIIFHEGVTGESSSIDHAHFSEASIAIEHSYQCVLVVLVRNFAHKEDIVWR